MQILYLKCFAVVLFFNLCFMFVYKVHFVSLHNIQHCLLLYFFLQRAFCVKQVYMYIFLMHLYSDTIVFLSKNINLIFHDQ